MPDYGVIGIGDILYNGLHAVMNRNFNSWIMLMNEIAMDDTYALYLSGHGLPGDAADLQTAINYLGTAQALYADSDTYETFQNAMLATYPEYAGQFFFSIMEERLYPKEMGLIEVITMNLTNTATAEDFLAANETVEAGVMTREGFLSRETAVSEDDQWRLAVHWETKEDSDNSIATFGEVPNVEDFMATLDAASMVITQYAIRSTTSLETTFPEAGVTEVITVRLQEGADVDGWLAANKAIEENHLFNQPGFIGRELGVTEEGEWIIVVHWETAADVDASLATFGDAPDAPQFMSYLNADMMALTVYDIQRAEPTVQTTVLPSNATVKVYPFDGMTLHSYTSAPETGVINGTYVIEGANELVVIDTHFAAETSADFRAYVDSIGKPIERVIITHEHPDHATGLTNAFSDTLSIAYAPAESILLIEDELGITIPNVITAGVEVIDGVTYDMELYKDLEAEEQVIIKFPGYGVIALGDILYNELHPVMNRNFEAWIDLMMEVQGLDEYALYLAGHGEPGDAVALQAAVDYLETAQATYEANDFFDGFQADLIAAYPEYGGTFFFSIMEERLYPKDPTAVTLTPTDQRGATTLVGVLSVLAVGAAGTWIARKS